MSPRPLPRTAWTSWRWGPGPLSAMPADPRAPRAEYWYFVLFTVLVGIGAQILDAALLNGSAVFAPLANLALFLPGLAVGVRRLHDRDRSGWWWLIGLIPVVGAIVLIVWFASRGTRGSNRFGYDPLPF